MLGRLRSFVFNDAVRSIVINSEISVRIAHGKMLEEAASVAGPPDNGCMTCLARGGLNMEFENTPIES